MTGVKREGVPVFGERMRQAMEERGISAGMLAIKTGMRVESIRRYRRGQTQPEARSLGLLAKGLGVSADWLIGNEEERE